MDLSKLPREKVKGLNSEAVESDRKRYWEKFYEKVIYISAEMFQLSYF